MRTDLIELFKNGECILEHNGDTDNVRFHEIMDKAWFSGANGNSKYYYSREHDTSIWEAKTYESDIPGYMKDKPIYTVDDFFKLEVSNYEIF